MAGTTDLMYFKSSPITLQGGTNNYLDIVLKHMFSQIKRHWMFLRPDIRFIP